MTDAKRPMEGWYLRDALAKLAEICAVADSMRLSLTDPLTEEDIAAGAEPLTAEQMAPDLEKIARLATSLALEELQATSDEWYSANDKIP
jgi:hypothetical protein